MKKRWDNGTLNEVSKFKATKPLLKHAVSGVQFYLITNI